MSIAHTPNFNSLSPDEQVRVLTQLGLGWAPLPGTDQWWVHPDRLGHVDAGPKKGRETECVAALASIALANPDDESTRRLIALGRDAGGVRTPEFHAALVEWVRERLVRALPIPDSLHREWSPKL
ncbi:MAG: hypothetical protein HRU70_12875 [Phycisphaeraceae bacterium]|nr:MAG: hypothetical protein HRU70_12875 [Phycisphaeraceae bacterium]